MAERVWGEWEGGDGRDGVGRVGRGRWPGKFEGREEKER